MRYKIHSSEIQDFYRNRYIKSEHTGIFSSMVDTIEANPFKMAIKEWKTNKLRAQLIQIESSKDLQICGGIADDTVILHFVSKGETSLDYGTNSYKMEESSNNIFTPVTETVNHRFKKNTQYEYFKVILPRGFVYSISQLNPEIFEPIVKSLKKQNPVVLHDKHCLTTMEMQLVIDQIKKCQSMGNIASLYFENKIKELLLLQLQQKNSQKCSTCSRYQHYNMQVNDAKNIIENQFKTPPTINELAMQVGMSATVLKSNFKRFFGTTIYGYLFDYRMNIAGKLLHETSFTIAEIAERSGYEHASHFTTAFKRKFGVNPVSYRNKVA